MEIDQINCPNCELKTLRTAGMYVLWCWTCGSLIEGLDPTKAEVSVPKTWRDPREDAPWMQPLE